MLAVSNVQNIEVIWTLIAVGGVFLAAVNTRLAHRAVKSLKRAGIDNGRTKIAKTARKTEIVRLAIQLIETYLGLIAMTIPPGASLDSLPLDVQIKAYSIQYGIVACAILTLVQSINSYILRRYFAGSKPLTRRDDDEQVDFA